ncbi:spore germination protein GerPE [Paenibacillus methanolicus]|uniref:Spore germination protein PE n=1 Tax=Paenibacillus methanolicus TaxID=582686 RepID=A0A5S5C2R9_9BACL|nr:spore germination protein GerPE [Paenibacillus methanolicus]TYP72716.1 spore germination protein PE [Paenibacillus methanolicus]
MNDYPVRVSHLGKINIISASSASIVQFGDRGEVNAKVQALAVQRQQRHSRRREMFFESYSVFSRPLPAIIEPTNEFTDVNMSVTNVQPRICVDSVGIIAVSSCGMIFVGNGLTSTSETRVKHIRQFSAALPLPPIGGQCPTSLPPSGL